MKKIIKTGSLVLAGALVMGIAAFAQDSSMPKSTTPPASDKGSMGSNDTMAPMSKHGMKRHHRRHHRRHHKAAMSTATPMSTDTPK